MCIFRGRLNKNWSVSGHQNNQDTWLWKAWGHNNVNRFHMEECTRLGWLRLSIGLASTKKGFLHQTRLTIEENVLSQVWIWIWFKWLVQSFSPTYLTHLYTYKLRSMPSNLRHSYLLKTLRRIRDFVKRLATYNIEEPIEWRRFNLLLYSVFWWPVKLTARHYFYH